MSMSIRHVKFFIQFAAKKLALPTLPRIHFVGASENKKNAFGHTLGNDITVRITGRHPIDVMRTIAHELYHFKQKLLGVRKSNLKSEDEANAIAGRIMRDFDIKHPNVFNDPAISNSIKEEVAANAIGGGAIASVDPLMGGKPSKKKELENHPLIMLQNRVDAMSKEAKSVGKNPNPLNNTFKNGNRELADKDPNELRKAFQKEQDRQKTKKLREVTKGK